MSEIRTHEQVAGIIGILCEEVANDVEMGAEERGDATRRAIEWLTATDAALRAENERLRRRGNALELALVSARYNIDGALRAHKEQPNLSAPAEEEGQ